MQIGEWHGVSADVIRTAENEFRPVLVRTDIFVGAIVPEKSVQQTGAGMASELGSRGPRLRDNEPAITATIPICSNRLASMG